MKFAEDSRPTAARVPCSQSASFKMKRKTASISEEWKVAGRAGLAHPSGNRRVDRLSRTERLCRKTCVLCWNFVVTPGAAGGIASTRCRACGTPARLAEPWRLHPLLPSRYTSSGGGSASSAEWPPRRFGQPTVAFLTPSFSPLSSGRQVITFCFTPSSSGAKLRLLVLSARPRLTAELPGSAVLFSSSGRALHATAPPPACSRFLHCTQGPRGTLKPRVLFPSGSRFCVA